MTPNLSRLLRITLTLAVLMLAVALRVALIEGTHPVMSSADEVSRFLNTLLIRHDAPPLAESFGIHTFNPTYDYTGFPPVQLWLHAAVQRGVESRIAYPVPSDYVLAARWSSLTANVLALVGLMAVSATMAAPLGVWGRALAAWFAGVVWAVAPLVIQIGNLALVDPLLYPFVPLTIGAAVWAVQRDRPLGVLLSVAGAIAAIYTKYIMIDLLMFPLGAGAVLLWRRWRTGEPRGWWQRWGWPAAFVALSASTAGWLVFGYNALGLENRETRQFYDSGLSNALSLPRNGLHLLATVHHTVGWPLFLLGVIGGLVAWRVSGRRDWPRVRLWPLAWSVAFALVALALTSSVTVVTGGNRARYLLTPALALVSVWGVLSAQMVRTLWESRAATPSRNRWPFALALVMVVPALCGGIRENLRRIETYAQPHIKQVVWSWADATLNPLEGKVLLSRASSENWLLYTWDRTISGYNGVQPFEWVHVDTLPDDPAALFDVGVTYAALAAHDVEGTPFDANALHLKTFAPSLGTDAHVRLYRTRPPQVEARAAFGESIALIGYDLSREGDVVRFRPFWQATAQPTGNYAMFVHLRERDGDGTPLAQADGPPASAARLTPTWDDPHETLVGAAVTVNVPASAPASLELFVGLYDFTSGERIGEGVAIPLE